ncbi:unnamed protein product [Symbiodinium microadriaticum]|nr:unnamed protein product [Symbiodinium microadriaticum]
MASMQDKVDEWSARYSAAHVEVSNLENQWKNRSSVELIDGSMEYAVATQQSAQQIIGDATTMDRTAVEECAAVTSDIVSDESSQCDWQFKYSRELQEISAMHASIIHMVHNHPLAPESSGEGEDTAAESVESPEDEFDGVTQESAPSLEAFKAQLHHYHRRVVELEDNCNRLEKELLYAHGINTKLTADLETVRSAVANQRDSSVSVIHELKSKITEQLGAITDRDLQLKECNIQLVVARQRAEVDAVEHKKNVMQLTDRSAELEISIRQLKSEVASIAEEKSRVEFERDDLQVKLTSEENKIVTKVQRYESDMRDMRSEYESLRKVCADTEDKMLRCAERNAKMVSELTSENDSLRASVKEMTSSVESRHLTKIHDLEANLAASESAVATLTTKFEEELNQLRNDCASYQHSAETSERELMDSIKSLNILEIKYRHANQMCSQLQVEKSSPKREGSLSAKTDMEGDNESVESKPIPATTFSCESEDTNSPGEDDSNEIVSSLLSQLESVIQEAQSREQEWGIARTSLTAAIEEWRNRASAAMSQSLALEKSCVTMKNERVQLESDVQTLRERLRVADREVVKLKDIVHSLECEAVRSAGCDVGQNSGDTEDTDMASLYSSDGAADMDEWGNAFTSRDALSKTLISQLNAANATLAQVSGSLLEGRAREEQLKLQLFELQEQFINAATSSGTEHTEAVAATPDGTYSDGTWKAAVKMLLKAWRSTRAQLASQTSHTESRTESCQSYFTNEEMDYIRSIANEALSQELCEEVLADTARRESSDYVKHIQGAQRDDCGNPGSTPVMSPMRGCDADENESGLWYVSSFDEEPELSTCLVDT